MRVYVLQLQALAFGLGKKKGKKITGNVGTQKEKEKIVKKVKENTQDGSSEDHDDDWRKRDEEVRLVFLFCIEFII